MLRVLHYAKHYVSPDIIIIDYLIRKYMQKYLFFDEKNTITRNKIFNFNNKA